jgi:hypothetical protein
MSRRKCLGNCGRWLTDPESVARGYGERCAELHGIPIGRPARRPTARPVRPTVRPAVRASDPLPEIHPDQTALDLTQIAEESR